MSRSSSSARTPSGSARLPPPTTSGTRKQMALIDELRGHGQAGKLGTSDRYIGSKLFFESPDRLGVELALDPCPRAGHGLKRPGEDKLLGRSPDLGEVPGYSRLILAAAHRLPEDHRVVHAAPV